MNYLIVIALCLCLANLADSMSIAAAPSDNQTALVSEISEKNKLINIAPADALTTNEQNGQLAKNKRSKRQAILYPYDYYPYDYYPYDYYPYDYYPYDYLAYGGFGYGGFGYGGFGYGGFY